MFDLFRRQMKQGMYLGSNKAPSVQLQIVELHS